MTSSDNVTTALYNFHRKIERERLRRPRDTRESKTPIPARYTRTEEEIAAAAALTRRITADRDLPEPEVQPKVQPQGPAWLTKEQQQTKRLEAIPNVDTTKAVQLLLPLPATN